MSRTVFNMFSPSVQRVEVIKSCVFVVFGLIGFVVLTVIFAPYPLETCGPEKYGEWVIYFCVGMSLHAVY